MADQIEGISLMETQPVITTLLCKLAYIYLYLSPMNASIRLKYLVQLALVDNTFDDEEMKFVVNVGRANNMTEVEINSIIKEGLKKKEIDSNQDFMGLSFDQKFEYLVSIIELMKVDGKIYLSEINYCKEIAQKLGFKKEVISRVTSKIHSDPSLSVDWNLLKDEIKSSLKED